MAPGSPAARHGVQPGETLLSINGEDVLDEIDYQALSASAHCELALEGMDGSRRQVTVRKQEWVPLGLCLDETATMAPRHCHNHCLFCFIDQLPDGMRDTLYVKDDDWRHSLMMGNYVTLTNVGEAEFQRILRRKVSPLYISVHATDPEVRTRLMRNPRAGELMDRLRRLKENGQSFHTQVVCCPGVNDGEVLKRTVEDLAALYPAAQTLAVVPIGLTKHRGKCPVMQPFTTEAAAELLDLLEPLRRKYLETLGTRFVFPSDEFYCLSGRPLPNDDAYEDYAQIENGVGMLRLLERECGEAAEEAGAPDTGEPGTAGLRLLIATGVSAQPFIEALARRYAPEGTEVQVIAVPNRFFGESITVTGLIVGQDLVSAVKGIPCDRVLISETMLRENTDRFLDDMPLPEVERQLGRPVRVVRNTGEDFIRALREPVI